MPISVYHSLTATTPDNTSYEIRPSHWNSIHSVSLNLSGTDISQCFSNENNVSFGLETNGRITGSANVTAAPSPVNVTGANGSSVNAQTIAFSNANGISLGVATAANGATVTGSYTVPSVAGFLTTAAQSNQVVNSLNGSTGQISLAVGSSLSSSSNGSSITFGLASNITSALQSTGAYLTTARASTDAIGLNTAKTNVTWTVNSSGLSFNAAGYAGTGTSATNASVTLNSNGLAISVGVGGAFSAGASNVGNTSGNTGITGTRLILAGGNNITVSQGTDANGATITISGANAGGAQTGISGIADSAHTQTVGTVSFANSNGFSWGLSTGANTATMTASYTVPVVTNSSWTVSDNATSATVALLAFTQSNGLTLSLSTSNNGHHTVLGSYTVPATAGLISGLNVSGGAGNSQSAVSGITFSNSNGITFGVSTGASVVTVTASYTVPAAGLTTEGIYFAGNTTGQSSSSTGPLSSINISGAGIISAGWSSNSIIISAPNSTGISQSLYATSNTTQGTSGSQAIGSILFAGAGNVSVGVTNGSVVISDGAAAVSLSGNSTSAGAGYSNVSSGTLILAGGNNITLSQNGASVTISGANAGGAQTGISGIVVVSAG